MSRTKRKGQHELRELSRDYAVMSKASISGNFAVTGARSPQPGRACRPPQALGSTRKSSHLTLKPGKRLRMQRAGPLRAATYRPGKAGAFPGFPQAVSGGRMRMVTARARAADAPRARCPWCAARRAAQAQLAGCRPSRGRRHRGRALGARPACVRAASPTPRRRRSPGSPVPRWHPRRVSRR